MQSTFLNAFRGFKRGVDPEFESAWLYKIAQNVCLTRQRSSSRRRRVESPGDLDAIQDILPSPRGRLGRADRACPRRCRACRSSSSARCSCASGRASRTRRSPTSSTLTQAAVETLLFRARRSLAAGLSDDAGKSKSIVSKLRAGTDAGSLIALAQSLLSFGGAKVAATVATVAATSVVASTPTARHAVEHAVAPVKPQHVAPAAHIAKPHAKHSFVATSALTPVAHTSAAASTPVATKPSPKHVHLSYASRPASLPVGHRPHTNATPDATVRPVDAGRAGCSSCRGDAADACADASAGRARRRSAPRRSRGADSRRELEQSRRDAGGACHRQARGQEQRQRREGQPQRQARTARDADRDAGDARSRSPAGSGSPGAGNARRPAGAGSGAARGQHARNTCVAAPGQRREEGSSRGTQEQGQRPADAAARRHNRSGSRSSRCAGGSHRHRTRDACRRDACRRHRQTTRMTAAIAVTAAAGSARSAATLGRASSGHADVAQLVEHFTRNEGVGSSSLPVGSFADARLPDAGARVRVSPRRPRRAHGWETRSCIAEDCRGDGAWPRVEHLRSERCWKPAAFVMPTAIA